MYIYTIYILSVQFTECHRFTCMSKFYSCQTKSSDFKHKKVYNYIFVFNNKILILNNN